FWLPLLACGATIVGLELLYRHTLVGHAFLAIAEDNFVARSLGLPERNLRIASYALAGVIGGLAGFSGGALLLAFVANGHLLNFYGFIPVALGGLGNNRGSIVGGFVLGIFQQAATFMVGGIFASVAVFALFIVALLAAPQGLFGRPGGTDVAVAPEMTVDPMAASRASAAQAWRMLAPLIGVFALAIVIPFI